MQIHFFVQCGQQCCVRLRGALYSKQNNTQRIPSHLKRNTVTITPVRAHATRENSYPDLESSWRPPADQGARELSLKVLMTDMTGQKCAISGAPNENIVQNHLT